MAPAEDLLDQRKADELFPEKQREDLVGEDFLDELIMETTDTMESAIRSCAVLHLGRHFGVQPVLEILEI